MYEKARQNNTLMYYKCWQTLLFFSSLRYLLMKVCFFSLFPLLQTAYYTDNHRSTVCWSFFKSEKKKTGFLRGLKFCYTIFCTTKYKIVKFTVKLIIWIKYPFNLFCYHFNLSWTTNYLKWVRIGKSLCSKTQLLWISQFLA